MNWGLDTLARQISRENDGRVATISGNAPRLRCASSSCCPKLLGTYEQELHSALEHAFRAKASRTSGEVIRNGLYSLAHHRCEL